MEVLFQSQFLLSGKFSLIASWKSYFELDVNEWISRANNLLVSLFVVIERNYSSFSRTIRWKRRWESGSSFPKWLPWVTATFRVSLILEATISGKGEPVFAIIWTGKLEKKNIFRKKLCLPSTMTNRKSFQRHISGSIEVIEHLWTGVQPTVCKNVVFF